MTSAASIKLVIGLLNARQELLAKATRALLHEMVGEDLEKKRLAARQVLAAANDISLLLTPDEMPQWLKHAIQCLRMYAEAHGSSQVFLSDFSRIKDTLLSHQWTYSEEVVEAFDFDAIFERHRKESKLPELFDQIVKILEEIHASNAIDSMTMVRALGKVIATMKKGKEGSYFSLNSAWEFLLSFLNNYIWGELSALPVLGSAFEALKKTLDETNEEMFKVHSSVQQEMVAAVEAEVRGMKRANFPFVSYNKSGRMSFENEIPRISHQA